MISWRKKTKRLVRTFSFINQFVRISLLTDEENPENNLNSETGDGAEANEENDENRQSNDGNFKFISLIVLQSILSLLV